ncbi:MAG: MerR family DNA-binding transcriptional regulator [Patescibacteria group bacterium]
MERKLISIKDAAKMLGVSTLTLRNWDKNGKLQALRHPMNNYRVYKTEDINNLIENISNNSLSKARSSFTKSKSRKLNVLHLEG